MIVIVDDLRYFPGVEAKYLRSLREAEGWWVFDYDDEEFVELWLDHDLGGEETIRPLVDSIEYAAYENGPSNMKIRVITDNPVGRKYIEQALERYYEILPARHDVYWRIFDEAKQIW